MRFRLDWDIQRFKKLRKKAFGGSWCFPQRDTSSTPLLNLSSDEQTKNPMFATAQDSAVCMSVDSSNIFSMSSFKVMAIGFLLFVLETFKMNKN